MFRTFLIFSAAFLLNRHAFAQGVLEKEVVEGLSDDLLISYSATTIGSVYAALINFAGNPDIGTAHYTLDSDEGDSQELTSNRFTYHKEFGAPREQDRLFLEFILPYQNYDLDFQVDENDRVDSDYRAVGVLISGGWKIALSESFTFSPQINTGVVLLENSTTYRGTYSENFIKPTFEGVLFDWDSRNWMLGASLQVEYAKKWAGVLWNIQSSLSHNEIHSYSSSSDFVKISSSATTFTLVGELVAPTPQKFYNLPVSFVYRMGTTRFEGPARDVLGFDSFYEFGVALEFDITHLGHQIHSLRLGGQTIEGEGVNGWSLILSYGF